MAFWRSCRLLPFAVAKIEYYPSLNCMWWVVFLFKWDGLKLGSFSCYTVGDYGIFGNNQIWLNPKTQTILLWQTFIMCKLVFDEVLYKMITCSEKHIPPSHFRAKIYIAYYKNPMDPPFREKKSRHSLLKAGAWEVALSTFCSAFLCHPTHNHNLYCPKYVLIFCHHSLICCSALSIHGVNTFLWGK